MLLEDGLLFSGDHVLSGSTTVIKFILPAHGHVIGGPDSEAAAAIARLKANLSLND